MEIRYQILQGRKILREPVKISYWNVKSLHQSEKEILCNQEMNLLNIDIIDITGIHWPDAGKIMGYTKIRKRMTRKPVTPKEVRKKLILDTNEKLKNEKNISTT